MLSSHPFSGLNIYCGLQYPGVLSNCRKRQDFQWIKHPLWIAITSSRCHQNSVAHTFSGLNIHCGLQCNTIHRLLTTRSVLFQRVKHPLWIATRYASASFPFSGLNIHCGLQSLLDMDSRTLGLFQWIKHPLWIAMLAGETHGILAFSGLKSAVDCNFGHEFGSRSLSVGLKPAVDCNELMTPVICESMRVFQWIKHPLWIAMRPYRRLPIRP